MYQFDANDGGLDPEVQRQLFENQNSNEVEFRVHHEDNMIRRAPPESIDPAKWNFGVNMVQSYLEVECGPEKYFLCCDVLMDDKLRKQTNLDGIHNYLRKNLGHRLNSLQLETCA